MQLRTESFAALCISENNFRNKKRCRASEEVMHSIHSNVKRDEQRENTSVLKRRTAAVCVVVTTHFGESAHVR